MGTSRHFPPPPGILLSQTVAIDVEVTRMPRLTNSCKTSGLRFKIGNGTLTAPLTTLVVWNTTPTPITGRQQFQLTTSDGDNTVDNVAHITHTEGPYSCQTIKGNGSLAVYGASRTVTVLVPDTYEGSYHSSAFLGIVTQNTRF